MLAFESSWFSEIFPAVIFTSIAFEKLHILAFNEVSALFSIFNPHAHNLNTLKTIGSGSGGFCMKRSSSKIEIAQNIYTVYNVVVQVEYYSSDFPSSGEENNEKELEKFVRALLKNFLYFISFYEWDWEFYKCFFYRNVFSWISHINLTFKCIFKFNFCLLWNKYLLCIVWFTLVYLRIVWFTYVLYG